MKKVIFYLPVSKKIGFGHLVRCSVLASFFNKKNFKCILVSNDLSNLNLINNKIFAFCKKLKWKNQSHNSNKIIDLYYKLKCDYIVIDDKKVGLTFQKKLFLNKVKWLQFQNSQDIRFYSNQLLYQNSAKHLKNKIQNQIVYDSKKYVILRKEFYKRRLKYGKSIFLCCGGSSKLSFYKTILQILNELNCKKSIIILVNDNKIFTDISRLKKTSLKNLNIKIYNKEKRVQSIIDDSYIAIISSGMLSHEVNSRGNKMILFSLANNQKRLANIWKTRGHYYLGDFKTKNKDIYLRKIKKILTLKHKIKFKLNSQTKALTNIVDDTKNIIN